MTPRACFIFLPARPPCLCPRPDPRRGARRLPRLPRLRPADALAQVRLSGQIRVPHGGVHPARAAPLLAPVPSPPRGLGDRRCAGNLIPHPSRGRVGFRATCCSDLQPSSRPPSPAARRCLHTSTPTPHRRGRTKDKERVPSPPRPAARQACSSRRWGPSCSQRAPRAAPRRAVTGAGAGAGGSGSVTYAAWCARSPGPRRAPSSAEAAEAR